MKLLIIVSRNTHVYSYTNSQRSLLSIPASSHTDDVITRGGWTASLCIRTAFDYLHKWCHEALSKVDHISHALPWIFNVIMCGETCDEQGCVVSVRCVKWYCGDWPCCNHDRELLKQSDSMTGLFITSGSTDHRCFLKDWTPGQGCVCVPFWRPCWFD